MPKHLQTAFYIAHAIGWQLIIYFTATHWVWLVGKIIERVT